MCLYLCVFPSTELEFLWNSRLSVDLTILVTSVFRVSKEARAAGVLDNFAEGEKYSEHFLRKYVRNRAPEIMPSINSFFTDPNRS